MKLQLLLILVLLTNLKLLASSRLGSSIRIVAVQGVLLGLLPLLTEESPWQWRILLLSAGAIALKGYVFPRLLFNALTTANVTREVQPFVGYIASLLFAMVALGASFWLGYSLPLPQIEYSEFLVASSFFGIFTGLFIIITRRRAISQVLGFLLIENGVFSFGVGIIGFTSLLVEIGILLDVFAAVFVMAITVFHISRECNHVDVDKLSLLKD
ncbi:MAG: hydrogenase [Verrucomicrobiae bacterium]|nr:hydrogenase [Verrucomicrobiae bacterium]